MPASAVSTRKNGNIAIRVDKAMWLAIAQPSSALNCQKASIATRHIFFRSSKSWFPARRVVSAQTCRGFCEISERRRGLKGEGPGKLAAAIRRLNSAV